MKKNILVLIIIESVLLLALSGGVAYLLVKSGPSHHVLPIKSAAQKTIDYINNNFMQGKAKAKLDSYKEVNGVYQIKLDIRGHKYTSYTSKDGSLLFPEAISLTPPKLKEFTKSNKPDVQLFVMAFCPFGNQAEELMIPVEKLLKNKADISLHYIVSKDANGKFSSLHGDQELHQDIRELCVKKYQPDKFWDFVDQIDQKATAQNVDTKWERIAKSLGIDTAKIKDCQKNEGDTLLNQEFALTNKEYPVQDPSRHRGQEKVTILGSPTLVINGTIYDGQRTSNDFKTAICSAFTKAPTECSQVINPGSKSTTRNGACK